MNPTANKNITLKVTPTKTKKELESLKIVRQFGIDDLIKYKEKIHKNIKVFEEAIEKENFELKRVEGMIDALEKDINDANKLLSKTSK